MDNNFLDFDGLFYQHFMSRLHDVLQPKTYFEIGTLNGETLKLSSCSSISVDPAYQISSDVLGSKPSCHFFQLPSDDFFAAYNPEQIFNAKIDFAFLDGMHLFEFLLRDFANTERHCRKSSVIVLHDCLPGDAYIAVRSPSDPQRQKSLRPGYWTGDVWKILPALRAWRPDLRIIAVNAPPTGLILITNLDPSSRVIEDHYQEIMDAFLPLDLQDYGVERLHAESKIMSTDCLDGLEDLAPLFSGIARGVSVPPQQTLAPQTALERTEFTYASPLSFKVGQPGLRVDVEGGSPPQDLRPGPLFHDDPDNAGLFQHLAEVTVPRPAPFVVHAEGVRQVGYRSYLTRDGVFFNDEALTDKAGEASFLARLSQPEPFANEDTGLRPARDGRFVLEERGRPIKRLEGQVVSLCSFEPTNYGAFLFRVLPKLAGRPNLFGDRLPFEQRVMAPLYNRSMSDLLELAGVPPEQVIAHDTGTIYEYDHLILPSLRNPHALLDEPTRAFYADLRSRVGAAEGPRKIFVSRLGWSGSDAAKSRIMRNEEEVARRLAQVGFEAIYPHEMSVREQIRAFSSADIIVGASGSAMFNTVFCRPGTKLVAIESEPHWAFAHFNLFGSSGLDYGIFEAKAEDCDWSRPHKPFTVNAAALIERVSRL